MNYENSYREQAAMKQGYEAQQQIRDPYAGQIKGNPIDRSQSPQLMQVLAVHEKVLLNLRDALGQLGERLAPLTPQTLGAEAEAETAVTLQQRPKSEVVCQIENMTQMVLNMERRVRQQLEVMDI
jgi:hypothetical protein